MQNIINNNVHMFKLFNTIRERLLQPGDLITTDIFDYFNNFIEYELIIT